MTVDTNAPERIWAVFEAHEGGKGHPRVFACVERTKGVPFIRLDLHEAAVRKAGEVQRLEALALEYRITLEMIHRHDGSSFYGPEGKKNERAQWRGIMRRVRQVLAASMPDQHAEALRRLADK